MKYTLYKMQLLLVAIKNNKIAIHIIPTSEGCFRDELG